MTENHIETDMLISIALGRADDAAVPHLASCAECQATVSRVRAVQQTLHADAELAGPSASAIARVKSLAAASRPATRSYSPWAATRRLAATLTFDSRASYTGAGLRGSSDSYLLSFAMDDVSLDIELEPPAGRVPAPWSLVGQLSRNDEPFPAEVVAVGDAGQPTVVESDEFGVFTMTLGPGQYDLQVQRDGDVVIVSEIDVG
jgi:hypothetical protein